MSADLNDQSVNVRQLLIDKLHDWKDGVSPVWNSTWPVFDRLIIRHHGMIAVYEELPNATPPAEITPERRPLAMLCPMT